MDIYYLMAGEEILPSELSLLSYRHKNSDDLHYLKQSDSGLIKRSKTSKCTSTDAKVVVLT